VGVTAQIQPVTELENKPGLNIPRRTQSRNSRFQQQRRWVPGAGVMRFGLPMPCRPVSGQANKSHRSKAGGALQGVLAGHSLATPILILHSLRIRDVVVQEIKPAPYLLEALAEYPLLCLVSQFHFRLSLYTVIPFLFLILRLYRCSSGSITVKLAFLFCFGF
jgi:hypothetical protein